MVNRKLPSKAVVDKAGNKMSPLELRLNNSTLLPLEKSGPPEQRAAVEPEGQS
jgi:hypothetical protein